MNSPRRLVLLLPLILVIALGCRQSKTPCRVSGKVTYKGQPVTAGTVAFHRQGSEEQGGGGVYAFPILSDGTYSGADLPAEEMLVTVETESANPNKPKQKYGPPGQGGGKEAPISDYQKKMKERGAVPEGGGSSGPYVKIPKKYSDKTKSGLKKTLTKGDNVIDFDLTD